jgi:uncharacterized protein YcbK (DUF882 family)
VSRFGVWLQAGGVGWYQKKEFTHIDTGRLRAWKGDKQNQPALKRILVP